MQNRSDVSDKPSRATQKKRYTSPRLSDYGSVRKLTHGNVAGSAPDGVSGMFRDDMSMPMP